MLCEKVLHKQVVINLSFTHTEGSKPYMLRSCKIIWLLLRSIAAGVLLSTLHPLPRFSPNSRGLLWGLVTFWELNARSKVTIHHAIRKKHTEDMF